MRRGRSRQRRFTGEICGFGTASGHRFVIGRWTTSPFGSFADVMHEDPDGRRTLWAPSDEVAEYVGRTYVFDEVRVRPVTTERSAGRLQVRAGELTLAVRTGGRSPLGWVLRTVPSPVATSPAWCTLVDPIARVVLRRVRTRGTAGNDRQEFYGATDLHRLVAVQATLDGTGLGPLTDVSPPVRFGFSSTPAAPSIVAVTTTIRDTPTEIGRDLAP